MQAIIVLQIVQGILTAAPSVAEGIIRAKAVIEAAFSAKLIDAATQNAQMAYVDSLGALAKAGIPPTHWTVEPDPV